MLIRFSVKNFLSFASREDNMSEEFSMIAGRVRGKKEHLYDDGKIKLLKFAAVYGANAAGKSNLVKAMDFMKQVVVSGLPDGHTEKYCKVNPENAMKPSYFEVEILLDGKYYSYGFEIILSQSRFISEWLMELHADNSEKILFTRDIANGTYELCGMLARKGLKEKLDVYADDIRGDGSVLFLAVMNQNKKNLYESHKTAAILKNVFLWIKDSLDINYPNQPISDYSYLAQADKVSEVCRIISAFGTGITDFALVDVPVEKVLHGLSKNLQDKILSNIEQKQVELESLSNRVLNYDKAKDELSNLEFELDTAPKYQLLEPEKFMSAKAYKVKMAEPVVRKLKELVKTVLARCFEGWDNYHRLNTANAQLYRTNQRLEKVNERLTEENARLKAENKDYSLLCKVFGRKQIDDLLEQARTIKGRKRDNSRSR